MNIFFRHASQPIGLFLFTTAFVLFLACSSLAGAQPPAASTSPAATQQPAESPPPASEAAQPTSLAAEQRSVAERFARLEALLLRSADLEAGENPTRAALLQQAVQLSKQAQLNELLADATSRLEQGQFSEAIEKQKTSRESLKELLELLQRENREERIREESQQVRRWIEETDRLLRLQSSLRGRTEGGQDAEQAAKDQGKLAEKAQDISGQLGEQTQSSQDKPTDEKSSEAKPSDEKPSDEKPSDEKPSDEKPSDEKPSDEKPSDEKPADADSAKNADADDKAADDKSTDDKAAESKPGESKPGESKPGESKPGESKPGESKPGESKPGESKPGESKPGESKPGESKPGESKPGESKPGESKPGESKPGESKPKPGESKPGESKPGEQAGPPKSPAERAKERIEQAQEKMKEAQEQLENAEREGAVEKQREAEDRLREAIEELEEILRQLREEEIERSLASLETRLRRMLEMQVKVVDETKRLQEIGGEDQSRQVQIMASKLSLEERKILAEGERAYLLLRDEGSSAAFPEAIEQVNTDISNVVDRLNVGDVGKLTVIIEEEIVLSLEEMVAALVQVQKENREKQKQQQQGQPQQGQPGDQPLVDKLAELRLIRTLQMRINNRTDALSQLLADPTDAVGQAPEADVLDQLKGLSERQASIQQVTRDIVVGKGD